MNKEISDFLFLLAIVSFIIVLTILTASCAEKSVRNCDFDNSCDLKTPADDPINLNPEELSDEVLDSKKHHKKK